LVIAVDTFRIAFLIAVVCVLMFDDVKLPVTDESSLQ